MQIASKKNEKRMHTKMHKTRQAHAQNSNVCVDYGTIGSVKSTFLFQIFVDI